jgi:hypothetical protein
VLDSFAHVLLLFLAHASFTAMLRSLAQPFFAYVVLPHCTHTLLLCCAVQVVDPVRASYGVDNAMYAVGQLAQTTMRRWASTLSFNLAPLSVSWLHQHLYH